MDAREKAAAVPLDRINERFRDSDWGDTVGVFRKSPSSQKLQCVT